MTVTFCGHSSYIENHEDKRKILKFLESSIKGKNVVFLLGGYGGFDRSAYSVASTYKKEHPNATLIFVTPYLNESYQRNHLALLKEEYDSILYPPIENRPPKFAITYRNRYMVDESDIVIAYVKRNFRGAFKTLEYAKKLNKKILNIAN